MAISCTVVAGLLCFHLTQGMHAVVNYHADATYAHGKGWSLSQFDRPANPAGYESLKVMRACAGKDCISFRRICDMTARPWCNYFLEDDGQRTIELRSSGKRFLRAAVKNIGLYRRAVDRPNPKSDFPLALLDRAAERRPSK